MKRILRISALLAVAALALFAIYGGRVAAFQHNHAGSSGRKVLYWYDAMDPSHHYDKPGKAPDGMDLVPKYADDTAPRQNAAAPAERKILYWYDPMHPAYKSDKPGKAPDCGMDLVPKYADDAPMNMAPGAVMVNSSQQQLIGVKTATVQRVPLVRTLRTTGQVTPDETRIAHVHTKYSGYLDRVFVDFVGQTIRKGQPLFTIYSPDLVATQEEYLIARRGNTSLGGSPFANVSDGAHSLLEAARERLRLWDLTDAQIKQLDETGKVNKTLTFYSHVSGIVQDRKAFPQTAVTPDMELYTVADLSRIWVLADVYEYELPFVRVGQAADITLSYYPGRTWRGRVSFINPAVDPQTRTVKVRIELPNPRLELKPQMFTDVSLKIDYGRHVVVPRDAVLDSGNRQIVFVAGDGSFTPRDVKLGAQVDDNVIVLAGLKPGETIATSGNFLIDSESRLKGAAESMPDMKH
jgi:multidrug efflux pump subunit AcrA (membrane-fusion protein)